MVPFPLKPAPPSPRDAPGFEFIFPPLGPVPPVPPPAGALCPVLEIVPLTVLFAPELDSYPIQLIQLIIQMRFFFKQILILYKYLIQFVNTYHS